MSQNVARPSEQDSIDVEIHRGDDLYFAIEAKGSESVSQAMELIAGVLDDGKEDLEEIPEQAHHCFITPSMEELAGRPNVEYIRPDGSQIQTKSVQLDHPQRQQNGGVVTLHGADYARLCDERSRAREALVKIKTATDNPEGLTQPGIFKKIVKACREGLAVHEHQPRKESQ